MKNPLIRIPLKYGIVAGLLCSATWVVLAFFVDKDVVTKSFIYNINVFLFLGLFIFFALKEFKDYYNEKILHFWQGMTIGFIIYVTTAVISASTISVSLLIKPDYLQNYIDERVELVQAQKQQITETIDEQAYVETLEQVKGTTAADLVWDDFLKKSLLGLFLTIILSIVMRKENHLNNNKNGRTS